MNRVVIVHCWEGYPDYCWYPQTKKELENKGFKVEVPEMPETELPKLAKWLPKLQEVAGKPDRDLYLIGHSSGVITIIRYLESLSADQKIGGAVFVAGFTNDLGYEELKNFFEKHPVTAFGVCGLALGTLVGLMGGKEAAPVVGVVTFFSVAMGLLGLTPQLSSK